MNIILNRYTVRLGDWSDHTLIVLPSLDSWMFENKYETSNNDLAVVLFPEPLVENSIMNYNARHITSIKEKGSMDINSLGKAVIGLLSNKLSKYNRVCINPAGLDRSSCHEVIDFLHSKKSYKKTPIVHFIVSNRDIELYEKSISIEILSLDQSVNYPDFKLKI